MNTKVDNTNDRSTGAAVGNANLLPAGTVVSSKPPVKVAPATLQAAYHLWLAAPHPRQPERTNADRALPERLNVQRALRALSLGSGGSEDLSVASIDALFLSPDALGERVREGLRLEALARRKDPPGDKVIANLVSCARALAVFARETKGVNSAYRSGRQKYTSRATRTGRVALTLEDWPPSLLEEYGEYMLWAQRPLLSEADGKRYRPKVLSEATLKTRRRNVGQYLRWRLENGLPCEHLTDLADPEEFSSFLGPYVQEGESTGRGGHQAALALAIALGVLVKYLVGTGRLDPPREGEVRHGLIEPLTASERLAACERLTRRFYDLGDDVMAHGARNNTLRRNSKVEGWTPMDLVRLGHEGFTTPPRRCSGQAPTDFDRFARQRSAMFFLLAAETPLRARNFREMRWNKNLTRTKDGRYKVVFRGNELKVKTRQDGTVPNEYLHTYSAEASKRIDAWREVLSSQFGPDFEREVPNVFPSLDLQTRKGGPISEAAFANGIVQLSLGLRDVHFSPHQARHTVASYVVNKLGPAGLALAARTLGDTIQTVLASYYRPDTREAEDTYHHQLYAN